MNIESLTIPALVVFFAAAAVVLYRFLRVVCGLLRDCSQEQQRAASRERRS